MHDKFGDTTFESVNPHELIVRLSSSELVLVQFIAEEVRDFASSTSALVGGQYRKVAELLTGKDIRTAKMVGLLADAWQSLSDKHS